MEQPIFHDIGGIPQKGRVQQGEVHIVTGYGPAFFLPVEARGRDVGTNPDIGRLTEEQLLDKIFGVDNLQNNGTIS